MIYLMKFDFWYLIFGMLNDKYLVFDTLDYRTLMREKNHSV